ncbi:MAG: FAD:protein FMN transferase [Proteobacteria bacterium]|nr:FAD:protein FMN transferase [Pseudomonadota bacterium]
MPDTAPARPRAVVRGWLRRARPWLGTLVDIGVPVGCEPALEAAFEAIARAHRLMSVQDEGSDLSRAHAAAVGLPVAIHPWTAEVLRLSLDLQSRSDGLFDVARGSGRWAVRSLQGEAGHALVRLDAGTRLDLGGIAKGWAVDQAVRAAQAAGAAAVWVNAGGDLRAEGVTVPVRLRDEREGGAHTWLQLSDGAIATSDFTPGARSELAGTLRAAHVSVAAPDCAWADALTKVLAQLGDAQHPLAQALLQAHGARAWVHVR